MSIMKNYHSVYDLKYHLVLVIKYNKKVITDTISKELEKDFIRISNNYGITLQEWNHDKDYIHALISGKPNSNISKFINSYKSASSRLVKKNHPELKQSLWEECFWSKSYYLATTGEVTLDIIKNYIKSQGETNDTI